MGWVGRVLKGHRAMEWDGLERSLKVNRLQSHGVGWVGRVLKGHRDMEWDGLERSLKVKKPWSGMGWKGP